jgi:predicted nucleic acid-binding protein
MNGHKYLADTNTLIFLLDRHPSLHSFLASHWHYSFITEIELLGKPGITPNEMRTIRELLNACEKVTHSDEINQLTISLKQHALIAATAIFTDLPLLTFDKGFTQIETLDIVLLEP